MTAIPASLFVQFIQQGLEKGLLKDITKTLDGEYYCNEQYLEKSISELVEKNGKIYVEKLAENLCIEQSNIKRVVQKIATEKKWVVFDDLILTQGCVDEITRDLESQINDAGCLSIIAQTQQTKLPYSLLKSILEKTNNDQEYIRYPQIPDVISTKEYIDNCKNKVINGLKSFDEPYPMFKLQKSQDIQEDMFYLLLEQVVKDEKFDLGLLRGKRSRAIFEPSSFKERQLSLIKSIFESNECISYNTIENLYTFTSPADLIADSYDANSFLTLNSCFIKSTVKDTAKASIEDISEYCDVNDLLPAILTLEDVNKVVDIILSEIGNKNNNNSSKKWIDLDGGYVVSAEYVTHLVTESNNYLRNLSRTLKQKLHKNYANSSINLSDNDIIKAFESLDCPRNIADRLLPFTRNSMLRQFSDILQTPFIETEAVVSGDEWIIQQKAREIKKLESLRQSIYFNNQAKKLFRDVTAQKSLEKYILKNQCTEFLYHLVIYLVLDQSYNKAEVSQSTSLCIKLEDIENQSIVDSKQQKCVVSYFIRENDHKYDNTSVVEIEQVLKKKKLHDFITTVLIQDKQHLFSSQPPLSSDQVKKTANEITIKQLFQQLQQLPVSAQTVPQMLHIVSLLIYQKVFQIPLYVTGKFVPVILDEIKPSLSQPEQALLDTVHVSIINDQREDHLEAYKQLKDLGMSYKSV